MQINWNRFVEEYNLRPAGSKGFYTSSSLGCPECGSFQSKLGVRPGEMGGGGYNCVKCGASGSLARLLKLMDRKDLLMFEKQSVGVEIRLPKGLMSVGDEAVNDIRSVELPPFYKRIFSHEYLQGRGWVEESFQHYEVGMVRIGHLKNYLVFPFTHEGVRVGWLARSTYSKDWHKKNLLQHKMDKSKVRLQLRWDNAPGVDFGRYLYGYDEITNLTHTVIIVEGLFDKIRTDQNLDLQSSSEIKCVCTFGSRVTRDQMLSLFKKKSLRHCILFYDGGTILEMKKYSLPLFEMFDKVSVAELPIPKGDEVQLDPGDLSPEKCWEIFDNLKGCWEYQSERLVAKNLL